MISKKKCIKYSMRLDTVVGIATNYGMDCPTSGLPSGQEIWSSPPPSRPALGSTVLLV
jgi:hypothetical protein